MGEYKGVSEWSRCSLHYYVLDDVGVAEFLQERNLSQGRARDAFVLHLQTDPLQ